MLDLHFPKLMTPSDKQRITNNLLMLKKSENINDDTLNLLCAMINTIFMSGMERGMQLSNYLIDGKIKKDQLNEML